MSDLNLTSFNPLYPMRVHQYDELFNDQNQGVPDKINSIIDYLNKVGKLTNDVVKDWNTVYQWVMNDGLTTDVNNKLEAMLANHEFDSIIDALATKVGDLNTLTTTAKDTIVNAINSLQTAVTANTTNIATNTANIATNTANIASNSSALAQSATQITSLQNSLGQQTKLKGVDIPAYLSYTTADLESSILRAKNTNGANLVILSVAYNQTTGTDSSMTANANNARLGDLIDYCNTNGITVAVKVHCLSNDGSAINPTDKPTWFTNWQSACLNVASICQTKNVKYLGISNELLNLTNGNNSNWQSVINAIKAQYSTLNLFLCVNKNEYSACVIYSMFDIIGFNFYPAMTLNGTSETDVNMRSAFHGDLDGFNLIGIVRSLKQTYNKPVWITECGCPSYANALVETSMFNGLVTYDEPTQNFYFKYLFDTVWNLSSIDAMCIWSIGDSQSAVGNHNTTFTYQYKQAESIVNQYWKGV